MDEPKVHELKCQPPYFEAVAEGRKTVEIRKDDRQFANGDILDLREFVSHGAMTMEPWTWPRAYQSESGHYTGKSCRVVVTHILRDPRFFAEEYVALSVRLIKESGSK